MTTGSTDYRSDHPGSGSINQGSLKETAKNTLESAKHEAIGLGEELKNQGSELAGAARARAQGLAEDQKAFGAQQVDGLARAANKAADELEEGSPQLARYVRDAASAANSFSTSLRERSIGDIMQDVTDFARREPVVFFGLTVAAGFALSRFLKSSASDGDHGPSRISGSSYRSPYGNTYPGQDGVLGQSRTPVASTHTTPAEYPTGRTTTTDPLGTSSSRTPAGTSYSGTVTPSAGLAPIGGSTVAGSSASTPTTFPSGTVPSGTTPSGMGGSGMSPKTSGGPVT